MSQLPSCLDMVEQERKTIAQWLLWHVVFKTDCPLGTGKILDSQLAFIRPQSPIRVGQSTEKGGQGWWTVPMKEHGVL